MTTVTRSALLARDLDELEQAAEGWDGPLKVQACGPWTMAASIELSRSNEPTLRDPGAVADLAASLAEGVAAHVAEVRKRVPGATVLLQLDEPSLPAALDGAIPSASGLNRVREVDAAAASAGLQAGLHGGGGLRGRPLLCAERPVQNNFRIRGGSRQLRPEPAAARGRGRPGRGGRVRAGHADRGDQISF